MLTEDQVMKLTKVFKEDVIPALEKNEDKLNVLYADAQLINLAHEDEEVHDEN